MILEKTKIQLTDKITTRLRSYFTDVSEDFTGMIPVEDVQILRETILFLHKIF